jgi:hypothetical protein
LTPVAESGASEEVTRAGLELATRDSLPGLAAVAEIRSAARELRQVVVDVRREC